MKYVYAVLNSPWYQALAPLAGAYLSYRYPGATQAVASGLGYLLSFLKSAEASK
jgi:hypothetical protein